MGLSRVHNTYAVLSAKIKCYCVFCSRPQPPSWFTMLWPCRQCWVRYDFFFRFESLTVTTWPAPIRRTQTKNLTSKEKCAFVLCCLPVSFSHRFFLSVTETSLFAEKKEVLNVLCFFLNLISGRRNVTPKEEQENTQEPDLQKDNLAERLKKPNMQRARVLWINCLYLYLRDFGKVMCLRGVLRKRFF